MTTRRTFLLSSAAATLAPLALPSFALPRERSALERVRIGVIGVGNQGRPNLGVHIKNTVAVCEVDADRLAAAKARVEKENGGTCAAYGDYRKMLESKDIDAVVITTPDHWHALMTIDACAAGKHVYCEKPLTLTVAEGRAMVKAARDNKRVVQTGSQQRSDEKFRRACEYVRNGMLGKVHTVRVGIPGPNFKGPPVADGKAPAGLDYERWLGPAPERAYNEKRVHYLFRFFWDYSGGQLTNFGAHHLDIAQWGLGMDESGPVSVEGTAKFHAMKWYETPETCEITYAYADGTKMICSMKEKQGTTFVGEKGSLFVTRGKIESTPGEILKAALPEKAVKLYVSTNHHKNWLDCVKSGKLPVCDVETGHRSATVCHLGNIAVRSGKKVTWDPKKEQIVGDDETAKMLSRPYRAPYKLPG